MGSVDREGSSTALPSWTPSWVSKFRGDPRSLVLFAPPRPVTLLADDAVHGVGGPLRTPPAMWARTSGIRIEHEIPAWQWAWVQRSDGGFLAVVEADFTSPNGRNSFRLPFTVPAAAIRPRNR